MKLFIFAIIIAAVHGAMVNPHLKLHQLKSTVSQRIARIHSHNSARLQLMEATEESQPTEAPQEDICAMLDQFKPFDVSEAECLELDDLAEADESTKESICKCLRPTIKAMMSALEPLCSGDCQKVLELLSGEDDGDSFQSKTLCPNRKCFGTLFDLLASLEDVESELPDSCSDDSDDSDNESLSVEEEEEEEEAGLEEIEKALDFYCSKNAAGDYCGDVFENAGEEIECKDETASCMCPAFSSAGCCTKTFFEFFKISSPQEAEHIAGNLTELCNYDMESMSQCPNNQQPTLKRAAAKLVFDDVKCGLSTNDVGYLVQKATAETAGVSVGDVGVAVDSCPCCSDADKRRRRLLDTGKVKTSVTISGDKAESASTKLNKAVAAGTFKGGDDLGEINADDSSEAKVSTAKNDIGTDDDDNSTGAVAPSLLVVALLAAVACF